MALAAEVVIFGNAPDEPWSARRSPSRSSPTSSACRETPRCRFTAAYQLAKFGARFAVRIKPSCLGSEHHTYGLPYPASFVSFPVHDLLVWYLCAAGVMTSRCEAFLVGPPMQEVGVALGHAEMKELVLAPSALAALGGDVEGEPRPDGCIAILHRPLSAGSSKSPRVFQRSICSATSIESMAQLISQRSMRSRANSDVGSVSSIFSGGSMINNVQRKSATGDYAKPGVAASALAGCFPPRKVSPQNKTMGLLDALPAFTPVFVRQSLMANSSSSSVLITEHRSVSVLFIVGTIKAMSKQSLLHYSPGVVPKPCCMMISRPHVSPRIPQT